MKIIKNTAKFHLPGLFEFYDFYREFLPLFYSHREYFYEWAEISSIYGAPEDSIWCGGRIGLGYADVRDVLSLVNEYGISARLTFSNSLLENKHLSDEKCNRLCKAFEKADIDSGVIVHSELLLQYLRKNYPDLYFISSTTKVITQFEELKKELSREEFKYVVPDFRMNKRTEDLNGLPDDLKNKVELLCNECCYVGCLDRKACYENVSRRNLDENAEEHICNAPLGKDGYKFSVAMKSPAFIGVKDIKDAYIPMGFSNFKIEGRELGSAILLEFLLYYLVKPERQLEVREHLYLTSSLDLF